MPTTETSGNSRDSVRRRGRPPADASDRRRLVLEAVAELESANVPFSMQDVADRAGISRATLYRDAALRDIVGSRGDGPVQRPVTSRDYEKLKRRVDELAAERVELRKTLRQLEAQLKAVQKAQDEAGAGTATTGRKRVDDATADQIRKDAYAEGFTAGMRAAQQRPGGPGHHRLGSPIAGGELRAVAARLPQATLIAARRTLARQLHPDLFAQDPAAAMLATELLKQINALIGVRE